MKKYYLYFHYRFDKSQVFYIGIGTKDYQDLKYNYYKRAYSNEGRSDFWINIVALNPNYKVFIGIESNDYDFILSEEIRLIKSFGRKDKKLGNLCNLTDGGQGATGYIMPDSVRELFSKVKKEVAKFGKDNHSSKKVYQYALNGDFIKEWACKEDCKRELHFNPTGINACCKGRAKTAFNFQWFDEYKGNKVKSIIKGKTKLDGYLRFKDTRYKKKNERVKSCQ